MKLSPRIVKVIKTTLKTVVILLIFAFLLRFIVSDRERIQAALSAASAVPLFLGAVCFVFGVFWIAFSWHFVLRLLGAHPSFKSSLISFYWAILGKYVPGKVWGTGLRIVISGKRGIPEGTAALALMMETLLLIVSAGIVGGVGITQWQGVIPWWVRWTPLISVLGLGLLHPRLLHPTIVFLSRRFPSWVILPDRLPGFRRMFGLVWLYSLVWLSWGTGYFFLVCAFSPAGPELFIPVVGGTTIAWLAGFVTVIFPAGIGIRELLLTYMLSPDTGMGAATLIAVLARLFTLGGEALGAAVMLAVEKTGKFLDR